MAASMVKTYTAKLAAAAPQTPFTAAGTKAVVVGGTNGIGLALAKKLASEGADVTIVGRSNRAEVCWRSLTPLPSTHAPTHAPTYNVDRARAEVRAGRRPIAPPHPQGVANIRFVKADLQSMAAAKACAASLPAEAVDLLIFTQGVLAEKERQETAEVCIYMYVYT